MIGSIKDRRLKRLFEAGDRSKFAPDLVEKGREHLGPAGGGSHDRGHEPARLPAAPAKGDRKGFWSVTVRANWRVIFRFEHGTAFDVELADYH
jgi:toxin HigB-1